MTITTLVPGRLAHLGTSIPIDGRLSWRAAGATGFEPIGGYLILDGDEALLVYTGVAAQRDQMVADVRACLETRRLSVLIERNEADVIGNLSAVTAEFDVECIWYSGAGQIIRWFTFDDENKGTYNPKPELRYMFPTVAGAASNIIFSKRPSTIRLASGRTVSLIHTLLTTTGHSWSYDPATGTLFTGDFFSHGASADAATVVLTEGNDTTTYEQVRAHLFERFYWIRDADVGPLLDNLQQIFAAQEVRLIAPNHGCVLAGQSLISRHLRWIQAAMKSGPGNSGAGNPLRSTR